MARTLGLGWLMMVGLLTGCDVYDRPNRPLPPLKATLLDGRPVASYLQPGQPTVINLWVPG